MTPSSLFCPIRKIWVAARPEERVRQALIQEMTQCLGYPMSNIVLEKNLRQLPHIQSKSGLPNRRIDLIVFAQGLHSDYPFYPLLLVECKAAPLTPEVLRQIVGYNQFVASYFIAAANQTELFLGVYHNASKDFIFTSGLLSYAELLEKASRRGQQFP